MVEPLVSPPNGRIPIANQDGTPSGSHLKTLQKIAAALNGTTTAAGIAQITLGNGTTFSSGGVANPNGVVAGNIGDQYTVTGGGAANVLWIKESGVPGSKAGWVGK